jgi:hypothetical protein
VFNLIDDGLRRLSRHPAHNRDAMIFRPLGTIFEVTKNTTGRVLFDFMLAGDVIDLLQSVETFLGSMANRP